MTPLLNNMKQSLFQNPFTWLALAIMSLLTVAATTYNVAVNSASVLQGTSTNFFTANSVLLNQAVSDVSGGNFSTNANGGAIFLGPVTNYGTWRFTNVVTFTGSVLHDSGATWGFADGAGLNKVWTSDGDGYGSWQFPSGGGSGIQGVTNENVMYITPSGTDPGTVGRMDLPAASFSEASVPDPGATGLTYIWPGAYYDSLALSINQNYYFSPGASLTLTNNNATNVFALGGEEPSVINVHGYSDFVLNNTNDDGSVFYNNSEVTSFNVTCNSITTPLGGVNHWDALYMVDGTNVFNVAGNVIGKWSGIHWDKGDTTVNCNIADGEASGGYFGVWSDTTSTGNLYVNARSYVGRILVGGQPSSRTWINTPQTIGQVLQTSGKLYISGAGKMAADDQSDYTLKIQGGEYWGNSWPKISCSQHGAISISQTSTNPVFAEITFLNIEDVGPTGIESSIINIDTLTNGHVYLHGNSVSLGTNGNGIKVGSSNVVLEIGAVNISSNANANPITVWTNGLTLKNCTLIAASGKESITATNSQTVVIDGTLTVNTAPSTNIIFTTGTLVVTAGSGSPEGKINAPWGSCYTQASSTNRWVKDSFSGNTGWINK